MKPFKIITPLILVVILSSFFFQGDPLKEHVREGDIIFQTSRGELGRAIQIATASQYSHVGIIYVEDGEPYVFEAVEPVSSVPLQEWIERGKNNHYVIKRLKGADTVLTEKALRQMRHMRDSWSDRHYDIRFEWSDAKLYCSELVWKIYERSTGIRLGEPAPLYSYHLDDELVKHRLKLHYGKDVPMEHEMIAPQAIFDSPLLETVRIPGSINARF